MIAGTDSCMDDGLYVFGRVLPPKPGESPKQPCAALDPWIKQPTFADRMPVGAECLTGTRELVHEANLDGKSMRSPCI